MLIVLLIALIFVTVLLSTRCFHKYQKDYLYESDGWLIGEILSGLLVGICSIGILISIIVIVSGKYIQPKIDMYQEENQIIEAKIEETVNNYLEYEGKTLTGLKTEGSSAVTIVAAYPELASSEIVKSQIDTYTTNNNKIKELKEDKISISLWKWWLYFGN